MALFVSKVKWKIVTARKPHLCSGGCGYNIKKGDRVLAESHRTAGITMSGSARSSTIYWCTACTPNREAKLQNQDKAHSGE